MTPAWFQTVASTFSGKIEDRGLFSVPLLRIDRGPFEAVVKLRHPLGFRVNTVARVTDDAAGTALAMDAKPRRPFEGCLQVSTEGVFTFLSRMFGSREIDVGDRAFDALYRVTGSDEDYVRRMLTPGVRSEIRTLGRYGDLRLSQRRQGVTWTVSSSEFDAASYERAFDAFLKAGLSMMEAWCSLRFEAEVGALVEAPAACPVCGAAADREVVRCSSCAVPHHKACWDYVGRCAIYGCGTERMAG